MAAVFPDLAGLTWPMKWTPMFATRRQTSASGQPRRTSLQSYPVWKATLAFDILRASRATASNTIPSAPYDEWKTLVAFFLARRGSYEAFWLTNKDDQTLVSQTIATGDGSTKDFPVIRTLAGSGVNFAEPVGGINPSGFTVTVGGSGASPTLNSPNDGWLHFASAPANGAAIVVSGSFYYRMTFERDETDFEEFQRDRWELNELTLLQAKL